MLAYNQSIKHGDPAVLGRNELLMCGTQMLRNKV